MDRSLREEQGSSPASLRTFESASGACRVDFERRVLETLRFESSRAMNGVGGLGIGGVLLGAQAGSRYRVLGWRPMPCDHSRGPAFLMSERDVAGLASFLEGVRTDAAARQWKIIGWFVSHPRGGMSLSSEEQQLQVRFFPPDGMVMVVHPDRMGDAECAVLVNGGVEAGLEFHVEPLPIEKKTAGERRGRSHVSARQPLLVELDEMGEPEVRPARRPTRRWWGAAAMFAVVLGGAGWALIRPAAPAAQVELPPLPPIEMLSLHAGPRGGRFVIEWNGRSAAIQFATRVSLLITDGERQSTLQLSRQDAMAGLQFYRPESDRVRVVLRLDGKRGEAFEEVTEYRTEGAAVETAVPLSGGVISSVGTDAAPAERAAASSGDKLHPQARAEEQPAPKREKSNSENRRSTRTRPIRESEKN